MRSGLVKPGRVGIFRRLVLPHSFGGIVRQIFSIRGLSALFLGLALLGTATPSLGQAPRSLGASGDWFGEGASGMDYYRTEAGSDTFALNCDYARGLDHEHTGIDIEIGGRPLPAGSKVEIEIDGSIFHFPTDDTGSVSLRDCGECADAFRQLWPMLRSGRGMVATTPDGRRATFSLAGTSKLLPVEACPVPVAGAAASQPAAEAPAATPVAAKPRTAELNIPESCGLIEPDPAALALLGAQQDAGTGSSRVALVVGMAGYSNGVPALRNPLNDIAAVVASFRDLGFAVYYVADGSAQAVTDCARRARAEHPDPQVSIFYYAGHGIQIEDENFLVATDADLTQDGDKGFLPVEEVLQTMRAGNGATLIFLDACRDNPFGAGGPSGLSPSTGRGITVAGTGGVSPTGGDKVQARGISVSYSTSPNAVAQDGDGELSPFATAITGYIGQPGHSLQRVMSAVNNAVGEATDWTQTPWTRSSLTAELKLAGSMTVEEARAASENWARRSRQFLETGRRLDAIAAALKGIPAYAGEAGAKRDYALAHEALVNAYLSGNSVASDEIAKRDRHLDHGSWMSPDRKFYASAWASERLFFTLHRSDDGEKIATLIDGQDTADYLTKVAYSSDRRFLAGGISDLTIWDVRTGEKLKNFANSPLGFFTFSPNSTSLLSVELYGDNIQVMSAENGGLLAELNLEKLKKASPELSEFLKGHNGSKVVAGYAGDDRICIATIGGNERDSILPVSVGFYDLKSGRYEMAGVAHAEKAWILNTINCSADGRWAAIGASDEAAPAHVHVWDARRGEVVADIATDGDEGNALFHSGSRQLAIDMGSGVAIYDVEDGKFAARHLGDSSASRPGLYSAAGKSVGGDNRPTLDHVWALMPPGTDLLRAASAELSPALSEELDSERVSLWRIN